MQDNDSLPLIPNHLPIISCECCTTQQDMPPFIGVVRSARVIQFEDLVPPGSSRNLPFPRVVDPKAPPLRTERHVPNSIASMRCRFILALVRTLQRCPCCNVSVARKPATENFVMRKDQSRWWLMTTVRSVPTTVTATQNGFSRAGVLRGV